MTEFGPGTFTPLSRRRFLVVGMMGAGAALAAACTRAAVEDGNVAQDAGRITARPRPLSKKQGGNEIGPNPLEPGAHPLGLGDERDGILYVPAGYQPDRPTALLVGLHGAGGSANGQLRVLRETADRWNFVVLAPDSRGETWDLFGYGPDVPFIDRALRQVFDRALVDRNRIWIEGFSDGASTALSVGLTNGDLFRRIVAFSPGYMTPNARRGHPRIFVSHGTRDTILPIDTTSRPIVAKLKDQGYDVRFDVFDGPHTIPPDELQQAARWLTAGA
jgi:phospholipase/carboxylesterase